MATLQEPKLYPRPEIDKMTKKQVEAALSQFLRQESPDDYGARLDRRKVQPWRDALWATQQKWREARDQVAGIQLSIFDLPALSPAPEEEKPELEDCDSSAPIADDFLSASGGDMSAPPCEVGADDQSKKPSVAEPQLKIDPLVELSPEELQQAQSLEAIGFSYVGDAEEFYPWEVELGVVGSWRFGSPQPEAGYLDARCRRALYSKCDDFDPDVDLDAFFDSEIETAKRAILSAGVKGGTAGSCTKSLPAASFAENSAQSAQTETEGSFDTELAAFVGEPPAIPQTAPLPPLPPVPPEAPATPDEDEEDLIVRGGLFGEHSANIVPLLKPEPSTETGVGKVEAKPPVEERAGAGAGDVEPVGTSVSELESKSLVDKKEIVRQIQAFWFQKRWDRKACECWIFEVLGVRALSSLSQLQLEQLLILAVAAGIPVPRRQPCYIPESQPPTRESAGVDVGEVEPELPVEEGVGAGDAESEPGIEEGVGAQMPEANSAGAGTVATESGEAAEPQKPQTEASADVGTQGEGARKGKTRTTSNYTGIQWTDQTWNPVSGCSKVSPGCANCYAEVLTKRFPSNFPQGFAVTLHPDRLEQPKRWRKPSRIFVNSMGDLFHENVPIEFLQQVFRVITETPWHVYQVLTKRHERLVELADQIDWPQNLWIGVSVENQNYAHRVDSLRKIPAAVRFLSCEPLISFLELDLTDIHWVIVGGESGVKHRPMNAEWARDIRDQCQEAGVPFFFKQVGGRTPKAGGRLLDGRTWDEMPAAWELHCQAWEKTVSPVALPARNTLPERKHTAPEVLAEEPASAGDNKELAQHQILRQLGYTEASALRSPAVFFGEASGWKLGYTCSTLDPSCVLLDAESSTGKVFSLCLEGVEGERIVVAKKELESVQQALLAIESCSGVFHARLSEKKAPQSSRHRWDFYQSPVWYGLVAIRELPLSGTVLEPCAGDGAIASVLSAAGLRVLTNDLNPALATNFHVDATGDWGTFPYVDWVITNPPFSDAFSVLTKAWEHVSVGVALFLRQSFSEPTAERGAWLSNHPPTMQIDLPRFKFRQGKGGTWATDSSTISLFVWLKQPVIDIPTRKILTRQQIPLFHDSPATAPSAENVALMAISLREEAEKCRQPHTPSIERPRFLDMFCRQGGAGANGTALGTDIEEGASANGTALGTDIEGDTNSKELAQRSAATTTPLTAKRPRVLDLFCGQGGASAGYHRAGYEVLGVDCKPQPRYPFPFVQADALEFLAEHWHEFDLIHASPPCQAFSSLRFLWGKTYPNLLEPTLDFLRRHRIPYVVENVETARKVMRNPVILCGEQFALLTHRHRAFECGGFVPNLLLHRPHSMRATKQGRPPVVGEAFSPTGNFSGVEVAQKIMECSWMSQKGLSQAIPPAYTEWLGRQAADKLGWKLSPPLMTNPPSGDLLAGEPSASPAGGERKGMIISFKLTVEGILSGEKRVTRRSWSQSCGQKWIRAWDNGQHIHQAWSNLPFANGNFLYPIRLTCRPYQEILSDMPDEDVAIECVPGVTSKADFLALPYFRGHEKVWVVRFEVLLPQSAVGSDSVQQLASTAARPDFFIGVPSPSLANRILRSDGAAAKGVMVSVLRLANRKSFLSPDSDIPWLLDSGAFTQISTYGRFLLSPEEYANSICRWHQQPGGRLLAAVSQDWMCEPNALRKTGLSVAAHQRLTIERFDQLQNLLVLRDSPCLMPVLQGWDVNDYLSHLEEYGDRLSLGTWVGVGSICRRGKGTEVVEIARAIKASRPDLRLHGFGVKLDVVRRDPSLFYSCDSCSWSLAARFSNEEEEDIAHEYQLKMHELLLRSPPRTAGAGNGQGRKSKWSEPTKAIRLPLKFKNGRSLDDLMAIARSWEEKKDCQR